MKKNYSEPKIKVQSIALQGCMLEGSYETGGSTEGGGTPSSHDRLDLLDDWN